MRAGKLFQRVTIQTNTPTVDSKGQDIESWADAKTVWAEAITGGATGNREFYAAQKMYAETSVVFRVRYDSTIVVTQRIKWLNRYYNILSIEHQSGRYRQLLISTKEVE